MSRGHSSGRAVRLAAPAALALTRSELVVIERAGHFPFVEQPEAFQRVVREFLARVSPEP